MRHFRSRPRRALQAFFLVAALLFTSSACTENGGAIFATIEQEQETPESNLPKNITVHAVVSAGTFTIAIASSLYLGTPQADGFDWSPDSPITNTFVDGTADPAAKAGSTCLSAVSIGGTLEDTLYAVFSFDDSGPWIYSVALPADPVAADLLTLQWSRLGDGAPASTVPSLLLAANNQVFVSAKTIPQNDGLASYELYAWDGAAYTAVISAATVFILIPVTDIAFDTVAYWCISGGELFTGDLAGMARYDDADGPHPAAVFGGLYYSDDTSTLFVSSLAGTIHARVADTWSASAHLSLTADADAPVEFTDFLEIGEEDQKEMYVGSRGAGFFRLTAASLTQEALSDARLPDRTISELYNGVILRFFTFDDEQVFLCTAGTGLWRYVYQGEWTAAGWRWE